MSETLREEVELFVIFKIHSVAKFWHIIIKTHMLCKIIYNTRWKLSTSEVQLNTLIQKHGWNIENLWSSENFVTHKAHIKSYHQIIKSLLKIVPHWIFKVFFYFLKRELKKWMNVYNAHTIEEGKYIISKKYRYLVFF